MTTVLSDDSSYSSVRRKSSISSAGSVSICVEPRAASATETFATRRDVGRLDDVHEVELAERRPLVQDLAAELLDVLVHLRGGAQGSI